MKMLSKRRDVILNIASITVIILVAVAYVALSQDTLVWKNTTMIPEPEYCFVCRNGNGVRYHAPVLVNLSTGMIWELKIYDNNPGRPWEVAEEQRWHDWVFSFLDGNIAMSWSSVDHTNIVTIGATGGTLNPGYFCRDCRVRLVEISNHGYALLNLYDLENIQAFPVESGAEYTIRDYTVSIYENDDVDGLTVEVIGHLFDSE